MAREPLKFGNVVVEDCLFCHVRVHVENGEGKVADGWGSIFLMDMWGWPTPNVAHPDREAAMRELQDFIEAVRCDRMPLSDGQLGRDVIQVIYGAYLSAERGQVVDLA